MKTVNVQNWIPDGTVMNATLNSAPQQLFQCLSFSVQCFFTGTPTGSFKLQMSDDHSYTGQPSTSSGLNAPPTHWTDITPTILTVSASGDIGYDYSWPGLGWVRLVYTDTSGGTSTATITFCAINVKSE